MNQFDDFTYSHSSSQSKRNRAQYTPSTQFEMGFDSKPWSQQKQKLEFVLQHNKTIGLEADAILQDHDQILHKFTQMFAKKSEKQTQLVYGFVDSNKASLLKSFDTLNMPIQQILDDSSVNIAIINQKIAKLMQHDQQIQNLEQELKQKVQEDKPINFENFFELKAMKVEAIKKMEQLKKTIQTHIINEKEREILVEYSEGPVQKIKILEQLTMILTYLQQNMKKSIEMSEQIEKFLRLAINLPYTLMTDQKELENDVKNEFARIKIGLLTLKKKMQSGDDQFNKIINQNNDEIDDFQSQLAFLTSNFESYMKECLKNFQQQVTIDKIQEDINQQKQLFQNMKNKYTKFSQLAERSSQGEYSFLTNQINRIFQTYVSIQDNQFKWYQQTLTEIQTKSYKPQNVQPIPQNNYNDQNRHTQSRQSVLGMAGSLVLQPESLTQPIISNRFDSTFIRDNFGELKKISNLLVQSYLKLNNLSSNLKFDNSQLVNQFRTTQNPPEHFDKMFKLMEQILGRFERQAILQGIQVLATDNTIAKSKQY